MTNEFLQKIWTKLVGIRPNLFLPATLEKRRIGAHFGVFPTYSELTGKTDALPVYWNRLTNTSIDDGLLHLASLNFIVQTEEQAAWLHGELNRKYLSSQFNEALKNRDAGRSQPDHVLVFHRLTLLLTMKSLVGISSVPTVVKEDPTSIGELILLKNDFVVGKNFKQEHEQDADLTLLLEMLPGWELTNLRDLGYTIARIVLMLTNYLKARDKVVQDLISKINLKWDRIEYDGLSLDDYISVILGLYAELSAYSGKEIYENPSKLLLDRTAFQSRLKIDPNIFTKFWEKRVVPMSQLRSEITNGIKWDEVTFKSLIQSNEFSAEVRPFQKYPMIECGNEQLLLLDLRYVVELLQFGVYWQIFDSLQQEKREFFTQLWGRMLELYIHDMLSEFYPNSSQVLFTNFEYKEGQIDAMLDFGEIVILFEIKGSLLSIPAKRNRDKDLFEKEIKLKFIENEKGKPKALRQLASSAEAIRNGLVSTTMKPKKVYPILISYEPVLESLFVNKYLDQKFQKMLERFKNDILVEKLTVMSVDELEQILPSISAGVLAWTELLDSRFRPDYVYPFSVYQAAYDIVKAKKAELVRNNFLIRKIQEIFSAQLERLKDNDSKN